MPSAASRGRLNIEKAITKVTMFKALSPISSEVAKANETSTAIQRQPKRLTCAHVLVRPIRMKP